MPAATVEPFFIPLPEVVVYDFELKNQTDTPLSLHAVTLEIGTIHQFQGSEADIVIFDVVDGRGRKKLGQLLRDDAGVRLVNVAITRARGKLILLADRKWYQMNVHRSENPLLWDILFKPMM